MIGDDGLGEDRGLLLGDGLFETILAEDGTPRFFAEHIERLTRGCETLGIAAPDFGETLEAASLALKAAGLEQGRAALRLTWTAGSGRGLERPATATPRLYASASPAPLPQGPARLRTSTIRRNETSPASRLKSLSYLDNVLARRQAREKGAD